MNLIKGVDVSSRIPEFQRPHLRLYDTWPSILKEVLGAHRAPSDETCYLGSFHHGILEVIVCHSAWIQLVKLHESRLLKRVQEVCPDLVVRQIFCKLAIQASQLPIVFEPQNDVALLKEELSQEDQEKNQRIIEEILAFIAQKSSRSN